MSGKEKAKFEEMAKNDKIRYDREMKSYVPPKGAKGMKKKKDPNAPKRPPSAFFVFCSEHRPRIKEENPGIAIGDIAKKLGELWSKQTDKDKAPYSAKAAKLKEKYERTWQPTKPKAVQERVMLARRAAPADQLERRQNQWMMMMTTMRTRMMRKTMKMRMMRMTTKAFCVSKDVNFAMHCSVNSCVFLDGPSSYLALLVCLIRTSDMYSSKIQG